MSASQGRVLVIAGSDSGGGAGIQADIKSVMALGGYATTALTALTAQNTRGVTAVLAIPPDFLAAQIAAVMSDIGADAIKTGMLPDAASMALVADIIEQRARALPLVLDPVMVATSGDRLMQADALAALRDRLLPLARIITPNLPEAEALCGTAVATLADMRDAAWTILRMGAQAVLLKGGHLAGETLFDVLATPDGQEVFEAPRIPGRNTHGTGCTLASAIAAGLVQDMTLRDAVLRARSYVRLAIEQAPGFGQGNGPLNHAVRVP